MDEGPKQHCSIPLTLCQVDRFLTMSTDDNNKCIQCYTPYDKEIPYTHLYICTTVEHFTVLGREQREVTLVSLPDVP